MDHRYFCKPHSSIVTHTHKKNAQYPSIVTDTNIYILILYRISFVFPVFFIFYPSFYYLFSFLPPPNSFYLFLWHLLTLIFLLPSLFFYRLLLAFLLFSFHYPFTSTHHFFLTTFHALSVRHPTPKTHEMVFSLSRDTYKHTALPYRPSDVGSLPTKKLRLFVVFPNPLVFSTNSRFNCLPRNAMPTAFDRWPLPLLFRADFEYLTSLLLSALTETKPIF